MYANGHMVPVVRRGEIGQWQAALTALPGIASGIQSIFGGGQKEDRTGIRLASKDVNIRQIMTHITPYFSLIDGDPGVILNNIATRFDTYMSQGSRVFGGKPGDPWQVVDAILQGGKRFATTTISKLASVPSKAINPDWNGKRKVWTRFQEVLPRGYQEALKLPDVLPGGYMPLPATVPANMQSIPATTQPSIITLPPISFGGAGLQNATPYILVGGGILAAIIILKD